MLRTVLELPSIREVPLLREQYRSLTGLMPVMYGAILSVVALLVLTFHATTPIWLNTYAPGALAVVVIIRGARWLRARSGVDDATPDAMLRACKTTVVLGTVLSFGFSLIGLFLMQYGEPAQQTLAILLIWVLAIVSGFCLYSVPSAAIGVVVAATLPLSVGFALDDHPIISNLAPVFLLVTILVTYVIREIYSNFASVVRASQVIAANEARSTHLAYHDALTGLPNRLLLAERLERALDCARREGMAFAVHCIDLDQFKEVNDRFGHEAGDDLIRRTSFMLASVCGPFDTLARLGGDEFALVQWGATQESAATLADELIALLRAPIQISAGRVSVGCSVGVSLVEDGKLDGVECLRRSDLALYAAKDKGRGRYVFFNSEMDNASRDRFKIRDELREALERDGVSLVYQPQVDNGVLYGVEALARWKHPELGDISPGVFVSIAEESELILTLGEFVMRRAFEDSRLLHGLTVAVNISAAQIRDDGFLCTLRALMEETAVDPTRIELEITEGLLLSEDPRTLAVLQEARAMGFRIALDDFGTGYSSLSYLQRYPIDKIKIDRSFVATLGLEGGADAIVGAIIRLARALRLDVIAEGVETEAQRVRLAAVGCGHIQGYLFGRPMPLRHFEQLLGESPAQLVAAAASA